MNKVLSRRGQRRQAMVDLLLTLVRTHELHNELLIAQNRLEVLELTAKVHKQLHSQDEMTRLEKENTALKTKVGKLQTLRDLYRKNLTEIQTELDSLRETQAIPEVPLP